MDVENMKKIIDEAFERERRKKLKEEQKEAFKESKLTYIGGIILLVIIGLMIVGFMIATVVGVARTIDDKNKATQYNLNCLTEPIEKPLEECRE